MKYILFFGLTLFSLIAYAQESVIDNRATNESDKVFNVVEQMPDYPGGEESLRKFIKANLRYPQEDSINGVEGRVVVIFVVEKDGSLSDISIKRSVKKTIDAEAMRIVGLFPKFKPGKQQGVPVRVEFMLPITFKLPEKTEVQTVVIKEPPVVEEKTADDQNRVFKMVEQMPEFPGGDEALFKFIYSHLEYPAMEKANDIQGRVIVGGVVEKDGSYSELVVKKSLSPNTDAEALRILKLLPKFNPGKQQGQPQRVYYYIPVMFKLSDDIKLAVPKNTDQTNQAADTNFVYSTADQMPEFPDGEDSLQRFFQNRILYPVKDRQNKVHGIVVAKIVVEKDGSITNPSVIKSLSPDIDKETLRIISRLPKFKPGINNGKSVRVNYIIPVIFKP